MSKVWLVIKREYLSRVKKKSFILMSILGPLIMAGIALFSIWINMEEPEDQHILVIDDSYPMFEKLKDSDLIHYDVKNINMEEGLSQMQNGLYTGVLHVVGDVYKNKAGELYFINQPSFRVQRQIEETFQQYIEIYKLSEFNISEVDYRRLKSPFNLTTFKYDGTSSGAEAVDNLPAVVGLVLSVIIYMFILLYSIQVMRGVIEEKTNRIVEVIISSVRPIQLMFGKILGVGAVGITQFVIWVLLTALGVTIGQQAIISTKYEADQVIENQNMTSQVQKQLNASPNPINTQLSDQDNVINQIKRVNFPLLLSLFVFYFLGGYFLYSAMMAAVGSAVDTDTETQQFVLPITFPLLLSYIVSFSVFDNPNGTMAHWMSYIPFTSPVVMLIRVAMNAVEVWELLLSMALLIVTFILIAMLSARIYRTGILMYGKKASYRELLKWLTYKN